MIDPNKVKGDSLGDLWDELNLGSLLQEVHATNLTSNKSAKDPFAGHKKILANPSYNAVMNRYNNKPRGPKVVSKETLSRLADPARGKFTSPSREAANDALFKQSNVRIQEEKTRDDDGTSFFLTDFKDTGNPISQKPPTKSSFRRRIDQARNANVASDERESDGPMSPSSNKYASAQRIAESKRKAKMMESLLNGQNAVRGARGDAQQRGSSQTRHPPVSKGKVLNKKRGSTTTKATKVPTASHKMSRNRQARVESQASIMRGRVIQPKYDAKTGRASRNRSSSRDPSVLRKTDARAPSTERPQWIDNTSTPVKKEAAKRDEIAKLQREERRKKMSSQSPSKYANNDKFNASHGSNSSAASSSSRKIPTGVVSGSKSASSIKRKPLVNDKHAKSSAALSPDQRRARTEQRTSKHRHESSTPTNLRRSVVNGVIKNQDGMEGPKTVDSEGNSSLQYSVSSQGSPSFKGTALSPVLEPHVQPSAGSVAKVDPRRKLFERKGIPVPVSKASYSDHSVSNRPAVPGKSSIDATSNQTKFPDRYKASEVQRISNAVREDLEIFSASRLATNAKDTNLEVMLKRAENISATLKMGDNGKKIDSDTASFASLLATHAKRISGQLESAQKHAEHYKKLTGAYSTPLKPSVPDAKIKNDDDHGIFNMISPNDKAV